VFTCGILRPYAGGDLVNVGGGISGHEVTLDESLLDVYSTVYD
jgi:hypothetical protein